MRVPTCTANAFDDLRARLCRNRAVSFFGVSRVYFVIFEGDEGKASLPSIFRPQTQMFKKRGVKGTSRVKVVRRDSDSSDSGDEILAVVKKAKKEEQINAAEGTALTNYESATKLESSIGDEKPTQDHTVGEHGVHPGQKAYATLLTPKSKIGPKKLSASIRTTTVFDYARDECKDFKQTGFCGYGDSCKFVHARDDFKAGWKLNTEWDLSKQNDNEKEFEGIPFKCVLCKEDYKNPIKTKCGHYYCEKCFLTRSKKTTTCFICSKDTENVALPAKNLKQLLKA